MKKNKIILCLICQILYNSFNVFFSWTIMKITDSLVYENKTIFMQYIYIACIGILCQIFFNFFTLCLENGVVNDIMNLIRINSLLGIYNEIDECENEKEKNSYLTYFTTEMEMFEHRYLRVIFNIVNSIILLLFSMSMIFKINKLLLLLVFLLMVLIMFIPTILSSKIQKLNSKYLEENEKMIKKTEEFLDGTKIIKIFLVEKIILNIYTMIINQYIDSKKRIENRIVSVNVVTASMGIVIIFFTFIFGGYLVLKNTLTVGGLLAVIQLITNMISPLTDIMYGINELNAMKEIKEKVLGFWKKSKKIKLELKELSIGDTLQIKDLCFSYTNQKEFVIKNINLLLEKGKTYAIVGENGCGKSTLAKIIAGYYKNYSGEITMDEVNVKNFPKDRIKNRIIYIRSKEFFFDASAKENCTLFNSYNLDVSIVESMKCEKLLEKDYSALRMSDGERQKIAFIRAFNKEADVLICDEADSAMDILAKKQFMELIRYDKKRIKIIVTHDISESLKVYDKIIYLKDGSVAQIGSFEELYIKEGSFYEFYNRNIAQV